MRSHCSSGNHASTAVCAVAFSSSQNHAFELGSRDRREESGMHRLNERVSGDGLR